MKVSDGQIILTEHEKRLMVSRQGFYDLYFKALPHFRTMELAYEAMEDQYLKQYYHNKYSSYMSFRRSTEKLK